MGSLLNFLSSIFGYILWFFFDAVSNYAVAVVLFALVVNVIMFPFAIKRQKSMTKNSNLAAKQQELKKKYEKNPKKYNEELAALYEKEGVNPMSGCFSMLLPLLLLGCVYGAVTKPLENTLHIPRDKVNSAITTLREIPELNGKITKGYEELQLVRHFSEIKDKLTMFNEEEFADVEEYSLGYNFMGLNLLNRPNNAKFTEMLWIIPVLCFLVSVLNMYIAQKTSGQQNQMQGCNKFMPYVMLLFTAYIAYTMPGAVGFYWIVNSLFGVLQTLILNRFYNIYALNAHDEASRFALLSMKDAQVRCNDIEE